MQHHNIICLYYFSEGPIETAQHGVEPLSSGSLEGKKVGQSPPHVMHVVLVSVWRINS